jgi:hypothetical protein
MQQPQQPIPNNYYQQNQRDNVYLLQQPLQQPLQPQQTFVSSPRKDTTLFVILTIVGMIFGINGKILFFF